MNYEFKKCRFLEFITHNSYFIIGKICLSVNSVVTGLMSPVRGCNPTAAGTAAKPFADRILYWTKTYAWPARGWLRNKSRLKLKNLGHLLKSNE